VRQGRAFDRVSSTLLYMLYSVPPYVMGMLLILYLGVKLDLLPFRGMRSDDFDQLSAWGRFWDVSRHYVMITFCFAFGNLAYYSRFVRQNLLEVIRQDYVRTARAKGLPERTVILRHAFRNSLIPLISLIGLTFPFVLSGSVILEYMFNWPGLGRLYFESVLGRDYPTIMALNVITAVLVLATTFVADLAYGWVDPRISYEH
jgi:peptide/nickel transport system permease protein